MKGYWTTTGGFVRKLPKSAGPNDTPTMLALVAYLTFGDPDPSTSVEVLAACAAAGAGVPRQLPR